MSKFLPSGSDLVRNSLIALAGVLFVAFVLSKSPKLKRFVSENADPS